MHIPDGFLDLQTSVAAGAIAAGAVGYASYALRRRVDPEKIPVMGVAGAFVFAAQMINFPVAGGTSGHLLGAALAAILLGPWAAVLVMTAVLVIQCFVFQDGGALALGANVLNMGLMGVLLGYATYASVGKVSRRVRVRYVASFLAAWVAVMAGAFLCCWELIISGTAAPQVVLPAMLGVHALIGVGEGVITVAALALVSRSRPDIWPALEPAEVAQQK